MNKIEKELEYQKKWVKIFSENKEKVLGYWYKYRYFNTIERICQFSNNKRILDIGCGISSILHFVKGIKYGIDPLAEHYKQLYSYPPDLNISRGGGEKLTFNDKYFDIIFCSNALDHTDDIYKTINEVNRVLKDDGYFILAVEFFKEKHDREPQHPYCLTLEEIYNLLSDFEIVFQKICPWIGLKEFVLGNEENNEQEIVFILKKRMIYKVVELKDDIWSLKLIDEIKKSPHYQTVILWKENINIDPEKTPYYQWLLEIIKKRGSVWNGILKTRKDILKQYNNFKKMFLNAPKWDNDPVHKRYIDGQIWYFGDYPTKIKNNGDIELYDGRHRLSILLALNLIPKITICNREGEWAIIKENLKQIYPDKSLYQPIAHPDYQDWKQGRDNEKDKILKNIIVKYDIESVIDLGICHGYSLYFLRDLLIKGIGIENTKERFKIANIVLQKCGFECYNDDIYNFIKNYNKTVDCIFALAVFHHFMKQNSKKTFDLLLDNISKKCKFLIYELPNSKEPLYEWIYPEIKENIDRYIQEKIGFKLLETHVINGRNINILSKNE